MLLLSCWLAPAKLRCDRPASSCSWASPLCSPPPCCRLLWSPNSWIWCHYINIQYSVLFTWWERRCPPAGGILGHPHHNCSLPMIVLQKMMSRSTTDPAGAFCWKYSIWTLGFIFMCLLCLVSCTFSPNRCINSLFCTVSYLRHLGRGGRTSCVSS